MKKKGGDKSTAKALNVFYMQIRSYQNYSSPSQSKKRQEAMVLLYIGSPFLTIHML